LTWYLYLYSTTLYSILTWKRIIYNCKLYFYWHLIPYNVRPRRLIHCWGNVIIIQTDSRHTYTIRNKCMAKPSYEWYSVNGAPKILSVETQKKNKKNIVMGRILESDFVRFPFLFYYIVIYVVFRRVSGAHTIRRIASRVFVELSTSVENHLLRCLIKWNTGCSSPFLC